MKETAEAGGCGTIIFTGAPCFDGVSMRSDNRGTRESPWDSAWLVEAVGGSRQGVVTMAKSRRAGGEGEGFGWILQRAVFTFEIPSGGSGRGGRGRLYTHRVG